MYLYIHTHIHIHMLLLISKCDIKIRVLEYKTEKKEGLSCKHLAAFHTRHVLFTDISTLAISDRGKKWIFKTKLLCKLSLSNQFLQIRTFRRGLSLVSMMKSYLQSSQQRVSELLIHWWRQDWWTKRRVPVQRQGVMRGLSSSPSQ